uniref:3CxxC-type domain-containing protein n=1 Tax=Spermophilus dauricus TaxID=99837 RepID=A0A8C9P7X3_SPEDA
CLFPWQVFQMLIQEVKPWHKWTLTADKGLLPNVLQPGWMQYQLWTFARFQCSSCSRSWASAHVQVLFHMHWSEKKHRGQVKMRVFAQRCKKCPQPPFEVPEFTQENISRVLNNLVIRILKKCYREGFKIVEEIPAIKDICLQGPHDSKNCEACLQGSCAQSGLAARVTRPKTGNPLPSSSLLAMPTSPTNLPTSWSEITQHFTLSFIDGKMGPQDLGGEGRRALPTTQGVESWDKSYLLPSLGGSKQRRRSFSWPEQAWGAPDQTFNLFI